MLVKNIKCDKQYLAWRTSPEMTNDVCDSMPPIQNENIYCNTTAQDFGVFDPNFWLEVISK